MGGLRKTQTRRGRSSKPHSPGRRRSENVSRNYCHFSLSFFLPLLSFGFPPSFPLQQCGQGLLSLVPDPPTSFHLGNYPNVPPSCLPRVSLSTPSRCHWGRLSCFPASLSTKTRHPAVVPYPETQGDGLEEAHPSTSQPPPPPAERESPEGPPRPCPEPWRRGGEGHPAPAPQGTRMLRVQPEGNARAGF